jgi:hypothetical protein
MTFGYGYGFRKAKMAPEKEEKLKHSCCEELGVIS